MNFSHPWQGLWGFLFLAVSLAWVANWIFQKKTISKWFSPNLVEKVFGFVRWKRVSFWQGAFRLASVFFLILALTGPQIGRELKRVHTLGSTVYILFDCSLSMVAEDLKPNRLERSKILLSGLLERLQGNRVGIIAFAGQPYVFCPLTSDLSAARQFLRSIQPGMIPIPGTEIGSAVRLALSKMPESGSRAIVLLTDGEDHKSDPTGAADEAASLGVRIFSVGVGNPEGEPIPIKDPSGNTTGFKRDSKGEIVSTKLDEATLIKMAETTDGAYFSAYQSDDAIDNVLAKLEEMEKDPLEVKRSSHKDRYQWFLGFSLLLLLLGEGLEFLGIANRAFRWASFLVILLFFQGSNLRAENFRQKIKEGNRLYEKEKYEQALEQYEKASEIKPGDPRANFNKGSAQYRLEDWEQAVEELEKSTLGKERKMRSDAFYNLGNAYFQARKYEEAVRSYQEGLRINPRDEDTKENLKLALRYMKNPPPESEKDKKDKKKKGQDQNQDSKAGEKEEKENAKRILKGASGNNQNRPLFKPQEDQKKQERLEDW